MEIVLPKLTSYQQKAWDWLGQGKEQLGKTMVISAPRQVGKTMFLQCVLVNSAFASPSSLSIIFEPTLSLARNVYRSIYKAFETSGLLKTANAQLLEIEFVNGSSILFRSTEQVSRGLTIKGGVCILDESAYLDSGAMEIILPFISAHNAPLILASTPFMTEGFYYDMWEKGMNGNDPNIKTFDWSDEPEISRFLTEERKALYKATMSPQKYRTEIEGKFLSGDNGLLFRNIDACVVDNPEDTNSVFIGIDFGTGTSNNDDSDYTALAVMSNNGQLLKMYKANNLQPMAQVDWLSNIILDWARNHTIRCILGEWNSIGSVYIDALNLKLKVKSLSVTNWITSNKSKRELIEALQIALENKTIGLLGDSSLTSELRLYGAQWNPKTNVVTYNATKGHDDGVISLALAWWAYKKSLGNFRLSFV